MRFRLYHLILLITISFSVASFSSTLNYNERSFDQEQISKWKNDASYNYDKVESPYQPGWLMRGIAAFLEFFSTVFGKIISIAIIIALIVGLFYFISKSDAGFIRNKKDTESIDIYNTEHIETIDFALKVQEALQQQNYRIAIRFLYLNLLKEMSLKNLIIWELDKTNHEYLLEMRSHILEKAFSKTTFLYEYAWYGDFIISKELYLSIEPEFKKIILEVNKMN